MTSDSEMANARSFIDGSLADFIKDTGAIVLDKVKAEYGGAGQPDLKAVATDLWHQCYQLRNARSLKVLVRDHDRNKMLYAKARSRVRCTSSLAKRFVGETLLSGAGRYAFLLLRGQTEAEAMRDVLAGYRIAMCAGKVQMVVGAVFPAASLLPAVLPLASNVWLSSLRTMEPDEVRQAIAENVPRAARRGEEPADLGVIIEQTQRPALTDYVDVWPWRTPELIRRARALAAFLQLEVGENVAPLKFFAANMCWLPSVDLDPGVLSHGADVWSYGVRSKHGAPAWTDRLTKRLKNAWTKYEKALLNSKFQLASSRYSLSFERQAIEDSFIDHWIGMEALLTTEGRDIGQIAAIKAALLLESSLAARKALRSQVLASYSVRSALVHGTADLSGRLAGFWKLIRSEAPRARTANMYVAASFTRQWLRKCLRLFAARPHLMDCLEDVLLTGEVKRLRRKC